MKICQIKDFQSKFESQDIFKKNIDIIQNSKKSSEYFKQKIIKSKKNFFFEVQKKNKENLIFQRLKIPFKNYIYQKKINFIKYFYYLNISIKFFLYVIL